MSSLMAGGAEAARAFVSAFAQRPKARVLENVRDAEHELVLSDARLPHGLHVENCERVSIALPHKVAAVTLVRCSDVQLRLAAPVLASVQLIDCHRCRVLCARRCLTYTADRCGDCSLHMAVPADADWSVLSTGCTRLQLRAYAPVDEKHREPGDGQRSDDAGADADADADDPLLLLPLLFDAAPVAAHDVPERSDGTQLRTTFDTHSRQFATAPVVRDNSGYLLP